VRRMSLDELVIVERDLPIEPDSQRL
jgi:hypothetical protein